MNERSFLEKSEEEIREYIFSIAREETGLENLKPVGVLRGFLEVFVKIVHSLYRTILNSVFDQADPEKKSGIWLDMWGLQSGAKRQRATATEGRVQITAYSTGSIRAGMLLTAQGTELRFQIVKDFPFSAGIFDVPVVAEIPGSIYNLPPGIKMIFQQVVYGIEGAKTTVDWISREGTNDEDDDSFRRRVKLRWASLGEGSSKAQWELVAGAVPGIHEAKVVRTPRGNGTVDLYISTLSGEKSDSLKTVVLDAIDEHRMISRDLIVKWPEDLKRNFHFEFSGPYASEEIEAAARDFILRVPMGGRLQERSLYAFLGEKFKDLGYLEIIEPTRDIVASGTSDRVQRIVPPVPSDPDGFSFRVEKND